MMDGDNINPAVTSNQQTQMEIKAEPAAEALLGLTKQLLTPIMAGSKLHESLMAIRNIPLESAGKDLVDVSVQADVEPSEVESQMNSKEANEWLEIAITALFVNNHKKAEQFLTKFNNLCPSNQVKLILDKMHLKISQISKSKENDEKSDQDTLIFERFLDIAYKAIAAKDLKKAQDFLDKAEKIKPMETTKKLLDNVEQDIEKQRTAAGEILIEHAMTAIDEDDYDVAEMLLKTAWIKYQSKHSNRMLDLCRNDLENASLTKYIANKTSGQLKAINKKYLTKAEQLISDGNLDIAESLLIIVLSLTCSADKGRIDKLLDVIHKILYPNTVNPNCDWYIGKHENYGKSDYYSQLYVPRAKDVQTYKCIYFLKMANRSYLYAGNSKLAKDFLNEAVTLCPSGYDVQRYFTVIHSKKRTYPFTY